MIVQRWQSITLVYIQLITQIEKIFFCAIGNDISQWPDNTVSSRYTWRYTINWSFDRPRFFFSDIPLTTVFVAWSATNQLVNRPFGSDHLMVITFKQQVNYPIQDTHKENFIELGHLNSLQTGQLNPLFHIYTNLVNKVGAWQSTDWWVSDISYFPLVYS